MLGRDKDSMVGARFALVDRDGLEKKRSPNVAEVKHGYVENPNFKQIVSKSGYFFSMSNLHLSSSQSLLQRRSSKPHICHPHCNNSRNHYPERLDHISTRVSELRLSSPRNALRKCWRCVATRKRLFRYRFLQKGAQRVPLQQSAQVGAFENTMIEC